LVWEVLSAVKERSRHDCKSALGDAIAATTSTLTYVTVGAQDQQLSPYACGLPFARGGIGRAQGLEPQSNVFVPEAL
jgi:hypothetical protein